MRSTAPSPFTRASSSGPPIVGLGLRRDRGDALVAALGTAVRALPAVLVLCLVLLSLKPASVKLGGRGPASLRGTASLRDLPLPPPRTPSSTRVGICAPRGWCGNGVCDPSVGEVCPPPSARATYANYQAAGLIELDVNSHHAPPATGWTADQPPPVATPADCAAACAARAGCSVWVFCADYADGCGECLPQYANADATLGAGTPPAHRFGPHGGCTRDGTYPYATCSLKRADNTTDAGLAPADDDGADSWISGVVERGE